jgi:hypothetical protein
MDHHEHEVTPKEYSFGFADIAQALGRNNDEAFQKRIKNYHKRFGSPIVFGCSGEPPKVERSKLIKWWNSLEDRWREIEQRESNRMASVSDSYKHGRDATAIPEIKGHEKQRRPRKS